jgi:Zn-dependent peptidase ImmA (M78 family)
MFERGFKSWSEKVSAGIRAELGLEGTVPLAAEELAEQMGVQLWTPNDVVGLPPPMLALLLGREAENWSATTISNDDSHAIIYNPAHSPARRSSDLMHELAHLLIEHDAGRILFSADGRMALRSFDRQQEAEANWLAGCLLLPRSALLHIAKHQMTPDEACRTYVVSRQLLSYRLNVTGVTLQMRRRKSGA